MKSIKIFLPIAQNGQPETTINNSIASCGDSVVEAHRQFLKLMFHHPVTINDSEEKPAVWSLKRLLFIAGTYHSLAVVDSVVKTYVKNLKTSRELALLCTRHPRDLLNLAIKLRRKWLFKEVVCRLIGDPTRDDEEISRIFKSYENVNLIL